MSRTAGPSASVIGSMTMTSELGARSTTPAPGIDGPVGRAAVAIDRHDRVNEVDHRADVVRNDRDDIAEARPIPPGGRRDDAVVIVHALDDEIRIADDRAMAREPLRPILREDL